MEMNYKGPIEAVLSTDLRSEPYNFSLWDLYTGTQLIVFKGNKNSPVPRCLQVIDNNHFITANDNVLQVWSIFNRKCQDQKLFLPKRPSSLCVSPCANYIIVGLSEAIYVWQLHSGNLLAHTQRHYQNVSVLKMNQEGTFLLSGGEDGLALVWPFADLISNTFNTGALNMKKTNRTVGANEPKFSWQHHSGPVTDIHITNGGLSVTVSTDMTANIYNIIDGKRLYNVIFPSPLWSVVINKNETVVFMGSQDGSIFELPISSVRSSSTHFSANHDSSDQHNTPMFTGHGGKIIELIVSIDGSRLVSASHDSSCKVWDIKQRKLLQDIRHQAPLANLKSLLIPDGLALSSMMQAQTTPPLSLKALKRNLYKNPRETTVTDEDIFEEGVTTLVHIKNKYDRYKVDELVCRETEIKPTDSNSVGRDQNSRNSSETFVNQSEKAEKLNKLKTYMRDLYFLSARKVFQDAAHESLQPYRELVEEIVQEEGMSGSQDIYTRKRGKKSLRYSVSDDSVRKKKRIIRKTVVVDNLD